MDTSHAGRVFVGVSGSLGGLQAIRHASAEARRRDGVMYAVRAYRHSSGGRHDAVLDAAASDIAHAFLRAFGGMPAGVIVKLVLDEGSPGTVLTRAADRPDDLIVIGGGSGRRWARRHGGTVRRCSRDAVCPVVIAPPPELTRGGRAARLARHAVAGLTTMLRESASERAGIRP